MNTLTTSSTTTPTTTDTFEIVADTYRGYGFVVLRNGTALTYPDGSTRTFPTRNAARKRISRERRGDFHR